MKKKMFGMLMAFTLAFVACSNENKEDENLKQYIANYKENNKDGFKMASGWYNATSTSTIAADDSAIVKKQSFKGELTFEDDTIASVTECSYSMSQAVYKKNETNNYLESTNIKIYYKDNEFFKETTIYSDGNCISNVREKASNFSALKFVYNYNNDIKLCDKLLEQDDESLKGIYWTQNGHGSKLNVIRNEEFNNGNDFALVEDNTFLDQNYGITKLTHTENKRSTLISNSPINYYFESELSKSETITINVPNEYDHFLYYLNTNIEIVI